MPISGSLNFSMNRDEILSAGFGLIGMHTEAEAPSAFMIQQANSILNIMLKAFVVDGLHLWVRKLGTIFLEPGKQFYIIGPGSGYGALGDTYVQTTLSSAAIATATTIPLASSSGFSVGNKVGIVLSTGTIQWTTVTTVPGATSITIPAPGLTGAASSAAIVYGYATSIHRPLRILHAVLRDPQNQDIEVDVIPLNTYLSYTDKATNGLQLQAAYNPALDNGVLYVWGTGNQQGYKYIILYSKPFDDADAATDTLEFPQEWLEAITYGLGARLSDRFSLPLNVRGYLWNRANAMRQGANDFDVENTSVFVQPNNEEQ